MDQKDTDTDSLSDAVDYIKRVQEIQNRSARYFDLITAKTGHTLSDAVMEVMKTYGGDTKNVSSYINQMF